MLKLGLVGLDSTHAVEFTRLINAGALSSATPPARVIAACAGLDTDFPLSRDRRDLITRQFAGQGIPLVASITELIMRVDAIMILSCDGRCHRREAFAVFPSGKPVFIDKPLAADWREAAEILRAARSQNVPCFSASALRFRSLSSSVSAAAATRTRPRCVEVTVPASEEPGHPQLLWHGIHGIEAGYALLGPGCVSVWRDTHPGDITIGTWPDGSELRVERSAAETARTFPLRVTGFTGAAGATELKNASNTSNALGVSNASDTSSISGVDYRPLLEAIVKFFHSRISPVADREMVETIAWAAAADLSRDRGGAAINFPDFLAKGAFDR